MPARITASGLNSDDLKRYPPRARAFATQYLATLHAQPLIFTALLLREIVDYDWLFPAERASPQEQLNLLKDSGNTKLKEAVEDFNAIPLSPALQSFPWATQPEHLQKVQLGDDQVLQHFELSLFTEGSGTQLFSTTFVRKPA